MQALVDWLSQPLQPKLGYLCLALLVSPFGTLVFSPLFSVQAL